MNARILTLSLCVIQALFAARAHGQARADRGWANRTAGAAAIAVMIDAGEEDACRGAGILAGYAKGAFYVLTAEHVIAAIQDEGSLAKLGVRMRMTPRLGSREEEIERRVPARVVKSDASSDLAALVIEAPGLVDELRPRLDFAMVGDSAHLVAKDSVYAIGCGGGVDWDIPIELTPVLPRGTQGDQTLIPFSRTYVREGFSGGPLLHVFQSQSLIVGMSLKVGDDVARAAPIHEVLARARSWNIPIKLTAPFTRFSCTYKVSPTTLALTGENRGGQVLVETMPTCPWGAVAQNDSRLSELQRYWLDVNSTDELGRWGVHFGSQPVYIAAGHDSLCDGRPQQAVVQVAGTMVQVTYDGRCTNPPPATASIPDARGPRYAGKAPPGTRPATPRAAPPRRR